MSVEVDEEEWFLPGNPGGIITNRPAQAGLCSVGEVPQQVCVFVTHAAWRVSRGDPAFLSPGPRLLVRLPARGLPAGGTEERGRVVQCTRAGKTPIGEDTPPLPSHWQAGHVTARRGRSYPGPGERGPKTEAVLFAKGE